MHIVMKSKYRNLPSTALRPIAIKIILDLVRLYLLDVHVHKLLIVITIIIRTVIIPLEVVRRIIITL